MLKSILKILFPKTIESIYTKGKKEGYLTRSKEVNKDRKSIKLTELKELEDKLVFSIDATGKVTIGNVVGWLDSVPIIQPIRTKTIGERVYAFGVSVPFHPVYLEVLDNNVNPKVLYFILSHWKDTSKLKMKEMDEDQLFYWLQKHKFIT